MSKENSNTKQPCTIDSVMQSFSGVAISYNVYEYKATPPTEQEIAKAKNHKAKESLKLILDLIVCLIFAPAISGFIGWLIPLQFSILTAICIGLVALEYFTSRRA